MNAPIHGSPIQLAAAAEPSGKKWQHVASAGKYSGYRGGKAPFEFTRSTFEAIVSNFRRHPHYGRGPVAPLDYEHASEAGLSLAGVAQHGAPACGWIHDVQLRDSGGTAQLWALIELGATAARQVRDGAYRWTSVAVSPRFIDPISGNDQGPTLTSIALTNKPFLQGLEPIAASMTGVPQAGATGQQEAALRTIEAINGSPGRNEIERANNYLCAQDPGHKALPRLEQIPAARRFVADVCSLASGGVRLSFDLASLDFEPKTNESRAALQEVARQTSEAVAGNTGLDYASRTLDSISRMPGADMIMKAVAFLDATDPAGKDRPLAERAKVAAFYLRGLREAVGNGKL